MKFENNCGNCLNTRMCKTFEILRENDIIDDEGDFVCGFYQRNTFKIFKEEYYHYSSPSTLNFPITCTATDKELFKNDN